MKPTKRQSDPLGRSTTRHRYSRYLLSMAIAITGSVWPIQARSIEPIFDICGSDATPGRCWCHEADVHGERRKVMPMKPERPAR
jgi:hypothetical protein